ICYAHSRAVCSFPTRRSSDLVGVGVRVAGLHLTDHVASVRLGGRVLGLGALTEEVRQSDRGQDADDQNDDEKLDQSETGLLGLNTCAELPQHVCPPWVLWVVRQPTENAAESGLSPANRPPVLVLKP